MKSRTAKQSRKARIYTAPANLAVAAQSSGEPVGSCPCVYLDSTIPSLRECVEAKYAAQEKHFKQTHGSLAAYSKLVSEKYRETLKRREAKAGAPEGFVPVRAK